jgi:hypothetical protein
MDCTLSLRRSTSSSTSTIAVWVPCILIRLMYSILVESQVLTEVARKTSIFWDKTLQSGESQETFWRNVSPPSSGSKRKPSKKRAWTLLLASCSFLAWLTLQPWRRRWYIPPKHRLTFTGLRTTERLKKTEVSVLNSSLPFSCRFCLTNDNRPKAKKPLMLPPSGETSVHSLVLILVATNKIEHFEYWTNTLIAILYRYN